MNDAVDDGPEDFAGDFYEWKNEQAIQDQWEETRDHEPSLVLRRIAGRWPELEWLCWLLPEDRRWYVGGKHEHHEWPEEYIQGSFYAHIPSWAFEALKS